MAIRKPLTKRPGASAAAVVGKPKPTIKRVSSSGKAPPRSGAAPKTTTGAGTSRGADGFAKARQQQATQQEEYERKKERPYPFRITQADITAKKNTVRLLYTDKEPFFVRLHTVPNAHGGFDDEVCLADTGEACPLCQQLGKEGAWTLVLTAIDKRPYRDKQGVLIKQSRKLVYVKSRNIDKFERQYKKHGTFRGLVVTHRRHGAKEASIGEDLEFETKLVAESVIKQCGDAAKPVNYAKAFEALSSDAMEARYAGVSGNTRGSGGARRGPAADNDEAPSW